MTPLLDKASLRSRLGDELIAEGDNTEAGLIEARQICL